MGGRGVVCVSGGIGLRLIDFHLSFSFVCIQRVSINGRYYLFLG